MKKINKRNPIPELADFIRQETAKGIKPVYEGGLDSKEEYKEHFFKIRETLVKEQGYICCYCQQRINIEREKMPAMKLEHFKPKELYQDLELNYTNLLAACKGYDQDKTHCDSCKGGKELQEIPNPANQDFERFKFHYLVYKVSPSLKHRKEADRFVEIAPLWKKAIDEAKQEQNQQRTNTLINYDPLTGVKEGCLNLNHQTLKSRRYSEVWANIANIFYKKCGNNWYTPQGKELASQLIKIYDKQNSEGHFKEFCQVAIDLLKKEFRLP